MDMKNTILEPIRPLPIPPDNSVHRSRAKKQLGAYDERPKKPHVKADHTNKSREWHVERVLAQDIKNSTKCA